MGDSPVGPLLDALGMTLTLADDQYLVEAMVIGKLVRFDGAAADTSLVLGASVGLDWVGQRGLLAVAADVLTAELCRPLTDED
jgi:hypothetical protein